MWHDFLFLKSFVSLLVSSSVRRTFNQPTDISFLLLDFSFRKDLVHYAAQILLTPTRTFQTQSCWHSPLPPSEASPYPRGAIHSTKIPTGPIGKSGPPQKVDPFFGNFSGWTEPIHWVLERNFRKFWLNGSRPRTKVSNAFSFPLRAVTVTSDVRRPQ